MGAAVIVGIDLHNIRDGGGVNYIGNLLRAADPERDGLERVHLFASPTTMPAQQHAATCTHGAAETRP